MREDCRRVTPTRSALELGPDCGQDLDGGLGWIELRTQPVHHRGVVPYVGWSVEVAGAGEVLDIGGPCDGDRGRRAPIGRVGEQGEASSGRGVAASGERRDLDGDVGAVGLFDQVRKLFSLYLWSTRRAAKRCLIDDCPQRGRVGCGQQLGLAPG